MSLAVGSQDKAPDEATSKSSSTHGKATTAHLLQTSTEEMQKFFKHIRKIHKYLVKLEQSKPRDPNFSESLSALYAFIRERTDSETASTMTSNFSMFKNYPSVLN